MLIIYVSWNKGVEILTSYKNLFSYDLARTNKYDAHEEYWLQNSKKKKFSAKQNN